MNKQNHPGNIRRGSKYSGLYGIGAAVGIAVVLTSLLYFRVALRADTGLPAVLPVAAVEFVPQDSYERTISYLGLVVAGRKTTLGFEVPGLIETSPPRAGTTVQRGDILASLDDTALLSKQKATAADLQQVRVERDIAQLKAKRQAKLITTGAVSEDAYDETRLRATALEARVAAEAARLRSIDIELEKSRLIAPYDGIVAERYVREGAIVNPGTPVLRLIETSAQESHIGVSAERARELRVGNVYTLIVRDSTFGAVLLAVHPDVDPVTRTATAVFAIPPAIAALDGEPVTLELAEKVYETGGWLPIEALLEGSRGVWNVLRLKPDGANYRTVREAVEILDLQQERAYVRGTLAPGALIVASGVHRVSPGSEVTARGAN